MDDRPKGGSDPEALDRPVGGAAAGAETAPRPAEPVVIEVEVLGRSELVTLREYVRDHVQDWDIGLREAWEVLAAAPQPLVRNAEDAVRHPEYLQLHTALDEGLLETEIERLEREGRP